MRSLAQSAFVDKDDDEPLVLSFFLISGQRLLFHCAKKISFKRGWGAYGHKLTEITTDPKDRAYTPGGPMPKEFRGHLTLNISNDGWSMLRIEWRTGSRCSRKKASS